MALALRKEDTSVWTYRNYYNMPDDGNRYEIIDGELFLMAAPSRQHQGVISELIGRFHNYLRGKPCRVYGSPFDVRLAIYGEKGDDVINVVQPDVLVYCSKDKVDKKGGIAAPEIAIEVLSPWTKNMDRQRKLKLYEKAGVKEYWIIDGDIESVEVYVHNGAKFDPKVYYNMSSIITSAVFSDFEINVSDIFFDPLA